MSLFDDVEKAASAVALEWPEVINAEELVQEIWLVLADRGYVETLRPLGTAARITTLRKIGHQIAMQYRAEHDWFSGQFYYSTGEVRALLKRYLEQGPRTHTERLDLEEGWDILDKRNANYSETLVQAYIHRTYDNTTGTARMNLSRAVDALTRAMNSAHKRRHAAYEDGPGSRKAVRNGYGQVMASPEWQGVE